MVPKFRAWDKDSKVIRSWKDLILTKDDGDDFWLIGYKENACITSFDHDQILMQSTGLKDKNGVEIFEGDIVAIKYSESGYHYYEKIFFENGTFIAGDEDWLYNIKDYCVVCGNVYENPELLEVLR